METRPALFGSEGAALGRKLTVAHLTISFVMGAWLILRNASRIVGGQDPPLDWLIAVTVLSVMHLPYTVLAASGLLSTLSWPVFFPLAAMLIIAGSIWWGFFTAWLVTLARRAFWM